MLFWIGASGFLILLFMINFILSAKGSGRSKNTREGQSEQGASYHQHNEADGQSASDTIADAINSYTEYRKSSDRERDKREKKTIAISGLAVIFAFVAAMAGVGAAWQAYRQVDQMRLEKRAWLSVSATPAQEEIYRERVGGLFLHSRQV
jgi:hypothetical protein